MTPEYLGVLHSENLSLENEAEYKVLEIRVIITWKDNFSLGHTQNSSVCVSSFLWSWWRSSKAHFEYVSVYQRISHQVQIWK